MKITKENTLIEVLNIIDAFDLDNESVQGVFDQISVFPIPPPFSGSYNKLKFRQLIDIQSEVKTFEDVLFVPFKVIHNIEKEDVLKMSAFEAIRVALFAKDELERIAKLFKEIEYEPTADEINAGINRIQSGFFGSVDWYARRMRITDHDIVTDLNWTIIYKCMKIDFENNQFERRYRANLERKNNKKR